MAQLIKMLDHHLCTLHATKSENRLTLCTCKYLTLGLLFTFHFSLLTVQSCGLDVEDPTPPSPPVWVQKSLPEEWPEQGIDAHESGGIFLQWETDLEDNIKTYFIYRAYWHDIIDSLGDYVMIAIIRAKENSVLEYVDEQVVPEQKYYYVLKAEDETGIRSRYSESVFYTPLLRTPNSTMTPNGLESSLPLNRELRWRDFYDVKMEDYCITILTGTREFILRKLVSPGNYVGDWESWYIPDNIVLLEDAVYIWRIDNGALYSGGIETAGSESLWATFVYTDY
jgi:hypothetical protein